ncbi:bifunctional [glutamate--ammonia ligase]-adenylyl-L-tyrosine phosphorylase/[glutamate--ammonia-ligase] adenylyltransferase [Candidatus Magnetaquicoccus inordinatus]|uniref:bifunctional [glutamate--ammonia ligase]-adenylyl-L-tyrosine phosphorylase/[glutamate--ammonia-ligase] adenylyltransferase n=1 Tax=Candidatus Magnetaquicoccus inordinatus TaxID=2496818 RepID=UPI00187D66C6|nr:bifunctional [glutamate--ammonia ligase]-adenylyl-L-tyrosine phosphorylase/[glutamate--ammonia-ligase] adenylyltransferase [Candidatus Magnetaquicoccus inordinatus]
MFAQLTQSLATYGVLLPTQLTYLQQVALQTAEPETIEPLLLALIESSPEHAPLLLEWLQEEKSGRRLLLALGNSPYLCRVLRRWPDALALAREEELHIAEANESLLQALHKAGTWNEAARLLRAHKHRYYFHIGARDLSGETALPEVVQQITLLAEGCMEGGYQWLNRTLANRYGQPMIHSQDGHQQAARFVIIGMGKLGARELNFSSDVDLIYLFDAGIGEVEGSCSLPIKEYYHRLGRDFIRLLGESTAEGHAFRVDLRLRPEGEGGDLVISCRSAEIYYEAWGQTWERAAMIKARPVAGDRLLGEEFLRGLQPFIFRRYLDFAALEAIREMKRKIDRKMVLADDYRRNVKLGYGGIREIEFFVQSQQLIHGGKNPLVRQRETLVTLQALRDCGLLAQEDCRFLQEAYQFLRTLEHRLQLKHDQQLHSLPEDALAFARLSKRMGMSSSEELQERFQSCTQQVHLLYQSLFYDAERQHEEGRHPLVEELLASSVEDAHALERLHGAGFLDPERALQSLEILRDGPRRDMTEPTRRWYKRIGAPWLGEILAAPDPDMALRHVESFLQGLGHRVSYLALLLENPPVLQLLTRLFGSSVLLSQFFMRHPELMDHLVARDFFQHYRSRSEMAADLEKLLSTEKDREQRINLMREFKNSETLRMGVRDLSHAAEPPEVMAGLSALAEVILARVLEDVREELCARHGDPGLPFVIVAMGKLGGRELNYASDLDLIFLHGDPGEITQTSGSSPMAIGPFFSRLGQRIINSITTLTRTGKLYELDMRLRPSGNSGTLVSSLSAFLHYQREEAWTWEHQALTRARVVAGDAEFAEQVRQEIYALLCKQRAVETIRREVAEMRQRLWAEKEPPSGWIDIKQSRGGIVDIEFLAQFLLLSFAAEHPGIVQSNTARALRTCQQVGLLSADEHAILEEVYGFLRLIENRLRLLHGRSENRIAPGPVLGEQLRRLCDLPEGETVQAKLQELLGRSFPIVQRYLQGSAPQRTCKER